MHLRLRVKDAWQETDKVYLCEACTKWKIYFNFRWYVRAWHWRSRILKTAWGYLTAPLRWISYQIRYAIFLILRKADYALQRVYKK